MESKRCPTCGTCPTCGATSPVWNGPTWTYNPPLYGIPYVAPATWSVSSGYASTPPPTLTGETDS